MAPNRPIDANHAGPRSLLRILGPLLLIPGCLLMLGGIIDFVSKFGSMETPTLFLWGCTLGMVLIMIGGPMTYMGYLGRMVRYMSHEVTPVATDTFNYAVHETRNSIRSAAQAVGEGLRNAGCPAAPAARCPRCGAGNDAEASFCNQCGESLTVGQTCPGCRHLNDSDARFCDNCGQALST